MATRTPRTPTTERHALRLGDVLASLAVIDLVVAPRGLDIDVGQPLIHDPAAPPPIEPGAIVLGVGIDPGTDAASDLLGRAGAAGAAAVMLKLRSDAGPAIRDAASRSGVAVLAMPPAMTWSQAHSLLRTAIQQRPTAPDDEQGDATIPLGDLFALANAVAAMVGGAVTIEDRQSRVLAYSTAEGHVIDEPRRETILGRRVPAEWLKRLEDEGVFRRLWAGEVVRYEGEPGQELQPRLAVAVRAGDTILGSIWVAEGATPLSEDADEALREAARIAALHLIRHRASGSLERSTRGDMLRAVFERATSIDAAAYGLGVRPDDPFAVLAFELVSSDEIEGALHRERVLDLVALYGEAFRQRTAITQIGRTIYVLLPRPVADRLIALARDIVTRARESLGVRLRAGIGSVVRHLRDVPRARTEADQVLRALASETMKLDVCDYESAQERIVLTELRDFVSERPDLRSRAVRELAAHDARHGTTYVPTLRAFLDAFGDIPRAAKSVNVHPNTFRYRLRRLVEVSNINLHDPEERLLAELDLHLRSFG
jgi:DNA-binding PucR family transcriptional regulator